MKRLVEDTDAGLLTLMGERITLFCANYIYTGKLAGVNDDFVLLEDAAIVYETGAFDTPEWKDVQQLPDNLYIMLGAVESFGVVK